jgi:hypothetical protein
MNKLGEALFHAVDGHPRPSLRRRFWPGVQGAAEVGFDGTSRPATKTEMDEGIYYRFNDGFPLDARPFVSAP